MTLASAALVAPGSLDSVAIVGGTMPVVVTGAGAAAEMATYRSVLLDGAFSVGTLDVEGTLMLAGAGSTLALGSLGQSGAAVASSIVVSGAMLSVGGVSQLGSASVVGGGRAQLGASVVVSAGVSVDAASCAEVGSGGSFWAGWLKVYAGATLSGSGVVAANVVVSGTVVSDGLQFQGLLVGSGAILLGEDGVTVGRVAAGTSLVFAASGAVLTMTSPLQMAGTLVGLTAGDAIDLPGVTAGAAGVLATLGLAGSQFLVLADGAGGTLLLDVATAGTTTPSPGNATPHRAAWTGSSGAAWGAAANWRDPTSGSAALVAPGSLDSVAIVGGAMPVVVTGTGAAAAMATYRSVLLDGAFAAGTLDVEGTLILAGAGSTLALGGLGQSGAAVASSIVVSGATLSVGGVSRLGSASVMGGGRAQLGASVVVSAGVSVDAASCAEVGSGGSFWAGWLKVYAGGAFSGSGVVAANVVVSGTVVSDGLRFQGLLVGSGTILLGDGGATVGRVAAGTSLVFAAAGAVLTMSSPSQMAGTLAGLTAGDAIDLPGVTATRASISGPTLSVFDQHNAVLAAFSLGSGAAQAATFAVLPDGLGGSLLTELAPVVATSAWITHPS